MERTEAEAETEGAGAATSSNTGRQRLIKRLINLAFGGGSIPLIVIGAQVVCPAIPSMQAFLLTLGVNIFIFRILQFASNYPPGNLDFEGKKKFKEEHPVLNLVLEVLNFIQLPVGIWGLVITLSNLDLYDSLCLPDDTEVCTTCTKITMITATVFCGIFLFVLIFIIAIIAKECTKAIAAEKLKKEQGEDEDEETKSETIEA